MKKIYFCFLLAIVFIVQSLNAQISFTNRNDLLMNADVHSGVAIAITDMNNDGLDDIIRMDEGYDLHIEYQVTGDTFQNFHIGPISGVSQWSMCIADIDNNGFNEIFAGGSYDNEKVIMANTDGTSYTTTYLPGTSIFVQGSNFADINNDGFLDVFACNDDAESKIWGNDGMGNLVEQNDWIDMATTPTSDNSGNYGSIWTDFDNDGDLDLYIAKCRQNVSSVTDPRRINALFVNDGSGNYTESAEAHGLKIGWQSWTSDFQDVNNDGYLDVFITNHDHESQLLINDGNGMYTEANNTGIDVGSLPIQGVMRDFDNDGFVDILVSGNSHQLFLNNGDLTFTEVPDLFDSNEIESFALGDLNGDGFVDIYAGYAGIYTNPSNIDDVVWMNDGGTNNYLAVDLQGVISNRNAIGSRIEIYGDWGIQIREVRSGESYGIMNSMIQYFGLGTATAIDSLVVRWPSGLVQTETNISINSRLDLLEGGCLAAAPQLNVLGATTFCPGETVTFEASTGYDSYLWSTGETTPTITVGTQGSFSVTVTDATGCSGFSSNIITIVDPALNPEINADGKVQFCEGESVILSETNITDPTAFTWSNGDAGASITVTESGEYSVMVAGQCSDFTSNSIVVEVWDTPEPPVAIGDTVMVGESATLTATGSALEWFENPVGGILIGTGETFITPALSASATYYVEDINIVEPGFGALNVGMLDHSGTPYSGSSGSNNLLIFDAFKSFTLDSVKVYTDLPGIRKMLLVDDDGNVLNSVLIDVPGGENVIPVGMDIPEGINMALTTEAATNVENLGINGPRLRRSSQDIQYPYLITDVVSLKASNFGADWYYYFYDWKISRAPIGCKGERTPVLALLNTDLVATIDFGKTDEVNIFPNPSEGNIALEIRFEMTEKVQLRVMDITGKVVLENMIQDDLTNMNLTDLAKGVYTIQVVHGVDVYNGKIVLQ